MANRPRILCAAGTLGYDAALLSSEGYSVAFNEPREYLFNAAIRELNKLGKIEPVDGSIYGAEKKFMFDENKISKAFRKDQDDPLKFMNNKPRNFLGLSEADNPMILFHEPICYLEDLFHGEGSFDVVLLLTNYISVYSTKEIIKKVLYIIGKVIAQGGTLIIDHRNGEKLQLCFEIEEMTGIPAYDIYLNLSNCLSMIKERWPDFVPYSSKYEYCGLDKVGPLSIDRKEPDDFDTITMKAEIHSENGETRSFKPYLKAIRWKAFRSILEELGYENIVSYSDLEVSKEISFQKERDLLSCDFVTHVATKV